MNAPSFDDLINAADKENEETLLEEIALDLDQLKELRELYHKHSFDGLGITYGSIIRDIKRHLKEAKEGYERRYGKKPDIEDAWRIFRRNRANVEQPRRTTRDSNNIDPNTELETLGL